MRLERRPQPRTRRDRRTSRWPALARRLLTAVTAALVAGVLATAASAATAAHAQAAVSADEAPHATIEAWPLWVEAGRGSSASVLAADGSLWWVGGGDADGAVRLLRNAVGEQLTPCGPALLVVDDRGRLRRVPRAPDLPVISAVGPQVSRYHKPACLPDGSVLALDPLGTLLLLGRELDVRAQAPISALPDAELVLLELDGVAAVAVLTAPTQRYRHGTLGDEVEAGALTLLRVTDLATLDVWRASAPAVIESRRVGVWRDGDRVGVDVTVSDEQGGARLVRLEWLDERLSVLATGEPLGASQRWLHLIGAVGARAYALHEPRVPGPLVRYDLAPGGALSAEPLADGLASHVDGERLLDRALLLGPLELGGDLLVVPRADQRALVWLACDAAGCDALRSDDLPSGLSSNLSPSPPAGPVEAVVAAERDGTLRWLPLPAPLAPEATAPVGAGR